MKLIIIWIGMNHNLGIYLILFFFCQITYYKQLLEENINSKIQEKNLNDVAVHGDKKITLAFIGNHNDRLPVIATAMNVKQLFKVPQMIVRTAYEIYKAIPDTSQR